VSIREWSSVCLLPTLLALKNMDKMLLHLGWREIRDDEHDDESEDDEFKEFSLKRESENRNSSIAPGPGLTSMSLDKFNTLSRWYEALQLL
jgi:hypothetical protein